jgi:hypothetical protein
MSSDAGITSCLFLRSLLVEEEGKFGLTINVVAISANDERELSFFLTKSNRGWYQEVRQIIFALSFGSSLQLFSFLHGLLVFLKQLNSYMVSKSS